MKTSALNLAKLLLGWPLSLIALFFLARIIFAQKDRLSQIQTIDYNLLILSIVCFFFYYFIRSFIWKELLHDGGNDIPLRKSTYLWSLSEVRRFIPGNIWSFLGRVFLFEKVGIPKKTTTQLLFTEAIIFVYGCMVVVFFGISFVFTNILPKEFNNGTYIGIVYTLFFLSLLIGIFAQKISKFIQNSFLKKVFSSLFISTPSRMTFYIVISSLSALFFGLGTYFSMLSIAFLHPKDVLEFVGFFVLCLLSGYLSVVTPMGLGVREGVMTLGLTPFVGFPLAAVLSIFTRLILILSDAVFLGFGFLWNQTKAKVITRIENFSTRHTPEILLGIAILVYILYFTTASFLRFDNFFTGRFDLGNMDQAVWNTLHGRIFMFTNPDGTNEISRLAYHADFILVLLSPFYIFWQHPKMLLLIQSVVVGLGAVFVYGISQRLLNNKSYSLVLGLLFLLNPAIQFTNLYDFHPVTLVTTFLLGTWYFLITKRLKLFLLFLFLSALTKEQVWILVGFLGIASYFFFKKKVLSVAIALVGFTMFYLLLWHIIPAARGGNHFALEYLQEYGSSPTGVVTGTILQPAKVLGTLLDSAVQGYLYQMFSPVGYLSFFSPHILFFASPDLALNILSSNKQLHQIYYQYTAVITSFIFISALYTLKLIKKVNPKILPIFIFVYLPLSTLFATYDYGPLPWGQKPNIAMFARQNPNKNDIEKVLQTIPKDASVAATNDAGSHLSQRRLIYTLPVGLYDAEYVVFLLTDEFTKAQEELANSLKINPNYSLLQEDKGLLLFKKN